MNAFLLYVVQSALCMSLFYGLYSLLLRREVFFRFNRSMLLAIMASSMTIPLIRMPVTEPALVQLPMMQLEEIFVPVKPEQTIMAQETENCVIPPTATPVRRSFNIIPPAYFAGLFVSLTLALVSFISVARIIVTARPVVYRQRRILVSPRPISSFTFAGWIVISEMDYERFAAEIVTHETIHLRNGHFWDLCLVNLIAVVHWFNPLVWLLRREVKTLHEYEADRCTLTQGINATQYKLLLIEKAAGASRYSVASSFAQSKIKKRIVMMNKQNPNPRARWKALLFIPLAALLALAFARPEINRELEQISTFKGTEILQENTGWTEEKFLEELRKSLPAGVSRELSYEDTWKEIVKTYQFEQSGKSPQTGMVILMNVRGDMLIQNKYATMEDVPGLVAKNLAEKGKMVTPLVIDGKEVDKIIRYTLIQRDMNTPSDNFHELLNAVGEAYISKRNEIARQYYQTGYAALDAEKKVVIDDIVPIMVNIGEKGTFSRTQLPTEKEWEKAAAAIEDSIGKTDNYKISIQGGTWKDLEAIITSGITKDDIKRAEEEWRAKVNEQQITYNGQSVKVKDMFELLYNDTNDKIKMVYRAMSKDKKEIKFDVCITGFSIKPENPEYYYLMNGKWVYSLGVSVGDIQSVDIYAPADAVKKFGSKAKNGAISITCLPVVVIPYNPDKK